jgi:ribosomal protein S5
MSALVIVGNGNGAVGYGEGKAEDVAEAVRKAAERARKNMVPVMRYDARTVYHDIQHKYKATKITLRARPPGFGNRANRYIHEICKCVGIQDISAKVLGSRNPINVVKGAFEALQRQRAPETLAKARGLKVVDVQRTFYETA